MYRRRFALGLIGAIAFLALTSSPAHAKWVNGWWIYPYKHFISNQLNFRPQSNTTGTNKGICVSDYKITNPPVNSKGIQVSATRNPDGSVWAYRWVAIWHCDISGLWRSGPGIHHDFVHITGGGDRQNIPTTVQIQDMQLHDGTAIPIMIQDGWFDKITLKGIRYWNTTTCVQIATINSGYINTIVIDNCPNISIALMGRPGSITRCYVRNSPGLRISDVLNKAGKSGVQIIYQ